MEPREALPDTAEPEWLDREPGLRLAFRHTPGRTPGVVFLGGFKSDMTGTKATRLEAQCRSHGQQFTRFDYRGHGQSDGRFEDATIADWAGDAVAVLERVTSGPQILVGSSMGGWMMLLAALARPERVAGLIGIAPAPDFVLRMAEALTPDERRALETTGRLESPSPYDERPYVFTRRLIEEGRGQALLGAEIPIDVPVRLLHGLEDEAVPWQLSLTLADRLRSRDVRVTFVKGGDHRLSNESDLRLLCLAVAELSAAVTGPE